MIGAGGAARAVVAGLLDRGLCDRILVANRTLAQGGRDRPRISPSSRRAARGTLRLGPDLRGLARARSGSSSTPPRSAWRASRRSRSTSPARPAGRRRGRYRLRAARRPPLLARRRGAGPADRRRPRHAAPPGVRASRAGSGSRRGHAGAARPLIRRRHRRRRDHDLRLGLTGSIGMGKSATAAFPRPRRPGPRRGRVPSMPSIAARAAPLIEAAFPGTPSRGASSTARTLGPRSSAIPSGCGSWRRSSIPWCGPRRNLSCARIARAGAAGRPRYPAPVRDRRRRPAATRCWSSRRPPASSARGSWRGPA